MSAEESASSTRGEQTAASGQEVTINFKVNTGKKFQLTLSRSATVLETKQKSENDSEIPAAQQRLIYRGRILKDAETLASHGIANDHTIHVVGSGVASQAAASAAPTSAPTPTAPPTATPGGAVPGAQPFAGMPGLEGLLGGLGGGLDPNLMAQLGGMQAGGFPGGMNPALFENLMGNPAVQTMMQQMLQTPEMIRGVIQANPFLSQMANNNPMLQGMLSNPEMLRNFVNPELMGRFTELQRSMYQQQQAGANPSAAPPTTDTTLTDAAPSQATAATATGPGTTPAAAAPGAMPWAMPGAAVGGAAGPAGVFANNPALQAMMNQVMSNPEAMQQTANRAAATEGYGIHR